MELPLPQLVQQLDSPSPLSGEWGRLFLGVLWLQTRFLFPEMDVDQVFCCQSHFFPVVLFSLSLCGNYRQNSFLLPFFFPPFYSLSEIFPISQVFPEVFPCFSPAVQDLKGLGYEKGKPVGLVGVTELSEAQKKQLKEQQEVKPKNPP